MHVAALTVDLHLPGCQSLKDKRAILRPILDGGRHRFPVTAAEVEHQDQWQRAALGFAVVSSSVTEAEHVLDAVERFVWSFPELEVSGCQRHWLDTEADW